MTSEQVQGEISVPPEDSDSQPDPGMSTTPFRSKIDSMKTTEEIEAAFIKEVNKWQPSSKYKSKTKTPIPIGKSGGCTAFTREIMLRNGTRIMKAWGKGGTKPQHLWGPAFKSPKETALTYEFESKDDFVNTLRQSLTACHEDGLACWAHDPAELQRSLVFLHGHGRPGDCMVIGPNVCPPLSLDESAYRPKGSQQSQQKRKADQPIDPVAEVRDMPDVQPTLGYPLFPRQCQELIQKKQDKDIRKARGEVRATSQNAWEYRFGNHTDFATNPFHLHTCVSAQQIPDRTAENWRAPNNNHWHTIHGNENWHPRPGETHGTTVGPDDGHKLIYTLRGTNLQRFTCQVMTDCTPTYTRTNTMFHKCSQIP